MCLSSTSLKEKFYSYIDNTGCLVFFLLKNAFSLLENAICFLAWSKQEGGETGCSFGIGLLSKSPQYLRIKTKVYYKSYDIEKTVKTQLFNMLRNGKTQPGT